MGCGRSSESKVSQLSEAQERKLRKEEAVLFAKIMKYDINLGQEPELPIEGRFTLENTNDMGESLVPQSTQVIFNEYKKFLFVVVAKLMRWKRTGRLDLSKQQKIGKHYCLKSPY